MSQEKPKEIRIEIQLDEETAQGVFANLAVVNHTDAEFVLDFIYVQPQAPRARVRSRIITTPRHVKRLVKVLEENLARYEERFGVVEDFEPSQAGELGEYH
ncbi:MAG: DUF3467 domain-containing protein [Geothermobacteraceae bacterium]